MTEWRNILLLLAGGGGGGGGGSRFVHVTLCPDSVGSALDIDNTSTK